MTSFAPRRPFLTGGYDSTASASPHGADERRRDRGSELQEGGVEVAPPRPSCLRCAVDEARHQVAVDARIIEVMIVRDVPTAAMSQEEAGHLRAIRLLPDSRGSLDPIVEAPL